MTTAEKIHFIVSRYREIASDFRDIPRLTEWSRRLACELFDYATEVGVIYKMSKASEFARKAAFERKRAELLAIGKTAAFAEITAKASIEKEQEQEASADAEYRGAILQYNAARDVLEAMRQQISSLKQERALEMSGQGSQGT